MRRHSQNTILIANHIQPVAIASFTDHTQLIFSRAALCVKDYSVVNRDTIA